jgi:hypothetical protein
LKETRNHISDSDGLLAKWTLKREREEKAKKENSDKIYCGFCSLKYSTVHLVQN